MPVHAQTIVGQLSAGYIPLIVAAVVVYLVAFMFLLAILTGWRKLARQYPADRRPSGLDLRGCSLRCPWGGHYSGCLNVTLSPYGIYIVPMGPFKVGHHALLLPWKVVGALTTKRFWRFERLILPIQIDHRKFALQVPASAREWIQSNQMDRRSPPLQ